MGETIFLSFVGIIAIQSRWVKLVEPNNGGILFRPFFFSHLWKIWCCLINGFWLFLFCVKRNDRDWTSGVVSRSFTGRTARWKSRRWPCSPSALRSARRVCSSCPTRRACSRANIGSTSPSSPWIKGNNQKSNPDPNCSIGSIDCQESPGHFSRSPFESIKCTELEQL